METVNLLDSKKIHQNFQIPHRKSHEVTNSSPYPHKLLRICKICCRSTSPKRKNTCRRIPTRDDKKKVEFVLQATIPHNHITLLKLSTLLILTKVQLYITKRQRPSWTRKEMPLDYQNHGCIKPIIDSLFNRIYTIF